MLGAISSNNASSAVIHGSLSNSEAKNSAIDMLQGFLDQAGALHTFFEGAKASYPSLATKFTALQNAEAAIKTKTNATNGLLTYHTTVDTEVDAILDTIFGNSGTDRETFEKYFDAYAKGQYLVSRDWQTEHGSGNNPGTKPAAATEAEGDFADLLSAIGKSVPGGIYDNRGTLLNIGTSGNFVALMTNLKGEMKTQILAKLGLTGVTNADAMAEALIIQLGQDNEEFRAFIEDLTKEGLTTARDYDYSGLIAMGTSQSDIKLAAVNPAKAISADAGVRFG
jgi:hypothetical protein